MRIAILIPHWKMMLDDLINIICHVLSLCTLGIIQVSHVKWSEYMAFDYDFDNRIIITLWGENRGIDFVKGETN